MSYQAIYQVGEKTLLNWFNAYDENYAIHHAQNEELQRARVKAKRQKLQGKVVLKTVRKSGSDKKIYAL